LTGRSVCNLFLFLACAAALSAQVQAPAAPICMVGLRSGCLDLRSGVPDLRSGVPDLRSGVFDLRSGVLDQRSTEDSWLGKDKARHFVASFLMTGAASYAARHQWHRPRFEGVVWGVGLTMTLGVIKELRDRRSGQPDQRSGSPDRRHPGSRASIRDLAADLAGAAAGAALLAWW
jgi:putative lipoprotein